MKTITRHIPNSITSLNLLAGCVAIVFAISGDITIACYLIFAAAIFDFFDGFAARLLKAYSPIGLQLDSLADVVSFGVAPSAILFSAMQGTITGCETLNIILPFFPFIIAVFSALRLAKFNIDTRQSESFIGMPTPACALFIASAMLWINGHSECFLVNNTAHEGMVIPKHIIFDNPVIIIVTAIVLSALLVSEIPMFSLKVKKQESGSAFIKKYALQLIFLLVSLLLIIFFGFGGIAFAILLYILLSIISWFVKLKK